jgi:hypothetical protein
MTERHGYGHGEQPGGERPSGRGAVAERRASQDEEVREVDLTDEAGEAGEREAPPPDREASGAFEPAAATAPSAGGPTVASTSIFDVGRDDPAAAEAPGSEAPGTAAAVSEPAAAGPEPEPAGAPEAAGAPTATAGAAAGPPGALPATLDAEGVRSRFLDIQAGFVDEPRQAVEEAGRLAEELVQQVIDALQAQRGQLKAPVEETSTEDLRLALRAYRQFVDRLLGLAL